MKLMDAFGLNVNNICVGQEKVSLFWWMNEKKVLAIVAILKWFGNRKKWPNQSARINPIGPGRFCDAYVPGGMFFHPPLKNDFLLQKRVIFHLDIKLGIILALF